MFKKIAMAALAAGAVVAGSPAAFAAPSAVDCDFNSVSQASFTGGQDTFTGVARGYVVTGEPGNDVSVRCYVRVDGTEFASTPTGSGPNAATTAGQVTYTASDIQDVDLCVEWTDGDESDVTCVETTTTQVPPQEVIDLIADSTAGLDPLICGALQAAGVPAAANTVSGVTGIELDLDDCDIYVNGERFIDFVPYDD